MPIYIGMKLHVKMALASEAGEEFCGAGLLQLLEGIGRHGSIQRAAQDMELSYVKALKILNRLEGALGESAAESDRPLLVEADEGTSYGTLVEIYARAIRAGVREVVLATRPPAVAP